MELKSEPTKYDTIQVTDIDIAYPGDRQTFTLRDGVDSYSQDSDSLVIKFGTGGTITFAKVHAHWIGVNSRTMRVVAPVKATAPVVE